jgi:CBS domain-containing protein
MDKWVCARRTVRGDAAELAARLAADAVALLQEAAGGPMIRPAGDGSFPLTLHNRGGRISRTVTATLGQVEVRPGWQQIPLHWQPSGLAGPLFPSFTGHIELEHQDVTTVAIAVIGTYHPPGSFVGGLIDAVAFSHQAQDTIDAMVLRLVQALSRPAATDLHQVVADHAGVMLVADVMTVDPVVLDEDTTLRTAANLLALARISGVPIVDAHGKLVGMLSEKDLLDKVAPERSGLSRSVEDSWRRRSAVTVGEACSRPARTTSVDTRLRDAAGQMVQHGVGRLVVMRGATVVGIVTRSDALRALVRADEVVEDAVRQLLEQRDADRVRLDVLDGIVTLHGRVELRSHLGVLLEQVGDIDGVLTVVHDDLVHDVDDVLVSYPTI